MDKSTTIRGLVFSAIGDLKYRGRAIPVFDEAINPAVELADFSRSHNPFNRAKEVYVVLQDQQEVPHSASVCEVLTSNTMVIRVVTVWEGVGSKLLCEKIGDIIEGKLRDERGSSLLAGVKRIEKRLSRSLYEGAPNRVAYSKVTTYDFII